MTGFQKFDAVLVHEDGDVVCFFEFGFAISITVYLNEYDESYLYSFEDTKKAIESAKRMVKERGYTISRGDIPDD